MTKRATIWLALLLVGAGGASASPEEASAPLFDRIDPTLDLSGTVRLDYFRSTKSLDEETDLLGLTAQLKALPTFTSHLDGKLEARFSSPPLGDGGSVHTRLLEGYLTWHSSKIDLRIGRQIVAWGRADGINPTDNLTPRDYVALLPFEDDQRFGTTAAKVDVFASRDHTVSLFASPFFTPHRVPTPPSARGFGRALPTRTFANTELGIRLNKVGEAVDWSLSYYRGFNLLPGLVLHPQTGSPLVQARYARIRVYGADFARNYGRFGFRGEAAYVDTNDRLGNDPTTINPSLFFVLGVDRTFLANLNVNLQYFRRQVRGYSSWEAIADLGERTLAFQNALIAGQRDHVSDGVTFRIGNKWLHDTLEAEIFGIVNFTTKDSFARPQVTYLISDHWKASVGFDWIRGANDTPFGSQKANRGAFVETRYSF